jgi:hypothetical protein
VQISQAKHSRSVSLSQQFGNWLIMVARYLWDLLDIVPDIANATKARSSPSSIAITEMQDAIANMTAAMIWAGAPIRFMIVLFSKDFSGTEMNTPPPKYNYASEWNIGQSELTEKFPVLPVNRTVTGYAFRELSSPTVCAFDIYS